MIGRDGGGFMVPTVKKTRFALLKVSPWRLSQCSDSLAAVDQVADSAMRDAERHAPESGLLRNGSHLPFPWAPSLSGADFPASCTDSAWSVLDHLVSAP